MQNYLPNDADDALVRACRDVFEKGESLGHDTTRGSSKELLGYSTGMANPLARIGIKGRALNTVGAIARFVWLIAGSDRLEDIAYYESRVRSFSDDELSVPGSSYGRRLFNSSPGTNQIAGVVAELRRDPDSRRAAAVVWLPEDAVRESRDIPCTFGLFFHVRGGGLVMTTVMRSNNAVTLLPYNFFEFSMLGEIVATEVGVPFLRYVHWAASMHVFDKMESDRAKIADTDAPESKTMPSMPPGDAMARVQKLAVFEAKIRNAAMAEELAPLAAQAREELGEYWVDLFEVLYAYVLAKHGLRDEARATCQGLAPHFRSGAEAVIEKVLGPDPVAGDDFGDALFDLEDLDTLNRTPTVAESVQRAADSSRDFDWLISILRDEQTADAPVTVDELLQVRTTLGHLDFTLAARDGAQSEMTRNAVVEVLRELRRSN
ncbi:thymidylate synthase [Pseudoclavibacter sp. VKM Ac-2888]|uniref:thymidylate synthase n=1 Tax=Pseudoclavibacter sp. VKM Ac-2888 TaxID=2783830 RepID=UPI00188B51E2|nr:thymidylate synthase [Pseudoclavibacter sp. VKM Ac-2888]MBF4549412.1 hypothetical protein [Pseudoclavibacter sp. VKM Ac-2888]